MGAVLGGIELGGTRTVCAVGTGPDDVRAEASFRTDGPDDTLARVVAFLRPHAVSAVGVASFGPLDLEGLASGRAIRERRGVPGEALGADDPVWPLVAHALALGLANVVTVLSPRRIVIGGGVMRHPGLLARVRADVRRLLAGYVRAPAVQDDIDDYIVAPALGARAGVLGALALAHERKGDADARQ